MISRRFLLVLAMSCAVLSGCATTEEPTDHFGPRSVVIVGSYDEIWRAVQKSLSAYPIQINNIDQGIIETEAIKGDQVWQPALKKPVRYANFKYSLQVTVVKGKNDGEDSAQVSILKKVGVQKDFFSEEQKIPTDGLEEGSILYRIEREMQIERSLKKAFERGKT